MVLLGGGAFSYERGTPVSHSSSAATSSPSPATCSQRELCIDNLLVRIHFIVVMSRWTGLVPWEFEFPFPGNRTSTWSHTPPQHATSTAATYTRKVWTEHVIYVV